MGVELEFVMDLSILDQELRVTLTIFNEANMLMERNSYEVISLMVIAQNFF